MFAEGSETWTKPHPDQQGWSHIGDHQLTFLFVFYLSAVFTLWGAVQPFSFLLGSALPSRAGIEVSWRGAACN